MSSLGLEALEVTRGNIRSLGPAGALGDCYTPYREWLALVERAIEAMTVTTDGDNLVARLQSGDGGRRQGPVHTSSPHQPKPCELGLCSVADHYREAAEKSA